MKYFDILCTITLLVFIVFYSAEGPSRPGFKSDSWLSPELPAFVKFVRCQRLLSSDLIKYPALLATILKRRLGKCQPGKGQVAKHMKRGGDLHPNE